MIVDNELINSLHKQALSSERLRVNYDLRDPNDDISLRLLTVMEPGTIVPIHRHRDTVESSVVLSGKLKEIFFDDNGNVIEDFIMDANGDCRAILIPQGQWHKVEVLDECTSIIEFRRGPYKPTSKEDILER